jgi:hypothetical protein
MEQIDSHADLAIRGVIEKINATWRTKVFDGLEQCFHQEAVIVGPGYAEFARGRAQCAESYREFATNASVLSYAESAHALRIWESVAVHTFASEMEYQRQDGPTREVGTDQLVFEFVQGRWQLVWRYIFFTPTVNPNAA